MALSPHEQQAVIRALDPPRYELLPIDGVEAQLKHVPDGATVSVTCSPSKGIDATLDVARLLVDAGAQYKVVPHLAARMIESTRQLDDILSRLHDIGIHGAFLVGGDAKFVEGRPYDSSLELAAAIRRANPDIELGVGAYPEGHSAIASDALTADLLAKQQYVDYAVTQMCFDADTIAEWTISMQQQGVNAPVVVGAPGIVSLKKLARIAATVGVGDSIKVLTKNPKTVLKQVSSKYDHQIDLVSELASQLADPGHLINGFHLYSFNQVAATEVWRQHYLARA